MNLLVLVKGTGIGAKFDEARFDVARFEAEDITNQIIWHTFNKIDNINSRVDTCTFHTRKYGNRSWKPAVGNEIEVYDGNDKIFSGVVIKVKEITEGAKLPRYEVECKDLSHYLDKRLVVERYENQTIASIISDIISKYASDFTVNNVDCDIEVSSIAFNYVPVSQAIQMLAEQVNYCWYVDYDKDIHFFPQNNETAPFNLSDTNGKYIFNSLEIRDDLSQIRNLVLIRGGEKLGNQRSEYFVGDGDSHIFPLANKFAEKPEVAMDGNSQTVGVEYLDDDASFQVLWNFNEKYIRFVGTPSSGSPIVATGTPYVPIMVQVQDDASIALYGKYEFKKIDKTIKTSEEAKQYALAQLEAYKGSIKEGSFQTYESGLRSGQIIRIQSTIRDIDEYFLIQKVSLKMRGYNEGIWSVDLATLRTVGIIDFLQRLLIDETKKIAIAEDEVLEKYYTDYQKINVAEEISLHTEKQDYKTIEVAEQIRKDPWTPVWVLAEYFPSDDADAKRQMRLNYSSYLS